MAVAEPRHPAARTLGLLYLVSGVLSLVGARWPATEDTDTALLTVLGAVGVAGAVALCRLGHKTGSPSVLHLALGTVSVLVAVLAERTVTVAGLVALGPVLICVGLYAAHFFSLEAARAHVALAVALATGGAAWSPNSGFATFWATTVVTAVVVTELQARLVRQLRAGAMVDPLTGLANRRAWVTAADRAVAEAERRGSPLTLVLVDLDDFKAVNDRSGHLAGDELLVTLAKAWTPHLRGSDLLARYGGDEFALLLPGTGPDGAETLLGRMRTAHPVGWSAGTASWRPGEQVDELLHRADMSLYEQKRARHR